MEQNYLYKSKSSGCVFALNITLYLILTCVIGVVLFALKITEGIFYQIISCCYSVLSIAIITLIFSLKRRESLFNTVNATKFDARFLIFSAFIAVGMLMGFGFINTLIGNLVIKLGGNVGGISDLSADTPLKYGLFIVFLAILPAIFEEFLFRGIILDGLKENTVLSLFISALYFALYHGSVVQLVYQFIYGFFLALLTFKSGSVIPAVITHFLNNLLVLSLDFFKVPLDLFSPVVIAIGIVLMTLTCVFLFLNKNNSISRDKPLKSFTDFFMPFGLYGGAICLALIVLNVVSV